MYKQIYRYWILIPLLLLAIVAREWAEAPETKEAEDTVDMTNTRADYYLEKFETRKLDAVGNPEYVITGDTLFHYPADDSSEIEQPNLTLHRNNNIWVMDSQRGKLTTNPDIFVLEGVVTMQRLPSATTTPITIRTSDLEIQTASNIVSTDAMIEVESPNWTLRSVGFESRIDEGILYLHNQVEGHYEVSE